MSAYESHNDTFRVTKPLQFRHCRPVGCVREGVRETVREGLREGLREGVT